jgi:mono/diheme cytochrome c family protein
MDRSGSQRQTGGRRGAGARRGGRRPAWLAATAAALIAACEAAPAVDPAVLAALEVPAEHEIGRGLYEHYCSTCHGALALGTEQGPPLVHSVYRPAHHGDEAFQLAVSQGVRAHHWRFGDMPEVPGLARSDVEAVTDYIRWLQRSAGIE